MNQIKIYSFLILCFAIMGISKAQNVGVGTTTPQNKLHVKGQLRVDTLTSGSLTADSVVLVGTNGVFKKVQFNAMPDQALGSIDIFPFAAIPSDYLECNGQAVSRMTYAGLFAKIGTTYGAGNGSTTFNIPDLRGEFVRGWDNGRGVDNSRTLGSWQKGTVIAANKAADFTLDRMICLSAVGSPSDASSLGFIGADAIGGATYIGSQVLQSDLNGPVIQEPTSSLMSNAVAGVTRPRNVAMVYAIKAKESVMIPTSTSSAIVTAATAYEPWYSTTTNTGATSNTENIYQMGNVGINTTTPTTKLHIDNGTTAGAIRIVDGTQGDGKVLTSDANGVGKWGFSKNKIYSGVTSTSTVVHGPATNTYLNTYIDLPPGKYIVQIGLLISNNGATLKTNSFYSPRLTLSTSSASIQQTNLVYLGSNLIMSPTHTGNTVGGYLTFCNGSIILEITGASTVRLYLFSNSPTASGTGATTSDFSSTNSSENFIYAIPAL